MNKIFMLLMAILLSSAFVFSGCKRQNTLGAGADSVSTNTQGTTNSNSTCCCTKDDEDISEYVCSSTSGQVTFHDVPLTACKLQSTTMVGVMSNGAVVPSMYPVVTTYVKPDGTLMALPDNKPLAVVVNGSQPAEFIIQEGLNSTITIHNGVVSVNGTVVGNLVVYVYCTINPSIFSIITTPGSSMHSPYDTSMSINWCPGTQDNSDK